jgi:hypothetical protein
MLEDKSSPVAFPAGCSKSLSGIIKALGVASLNLKIELYHKSAQSLAQGRGSDGDCQNSFGKNAVAIPANQWPVVSSSCSLQNTAQKPFNPLRLTTSLCFYSENRFSRFRSKVKT